MKYTIFSIDDSRKSYTDSIRRTLERSFMEYEPTAAVNGADSDSLEYNISKHGYELNWMDVIPPKVGQLGIWYTVLNSFELAPHVTFEDDAILGQNFTLNWRMRHRQIPDDADFFSLFLPRDSDHMYDPSMSVDRLVTKTYQRYGGVSMYYTEQGVDKIRWLLKRDGITDQYDNTLYRYSKAGELNGYCSKPELQDLVYISGVEDSIVQTSGMYRESLFDYEEEINVG